MKPVRGFTMIELLIGLSIGLFGLLAIGKVMLTFTQQRATISQGMVTQSNGVLALYHLERNLAQAGYGMMPLQACSAITDGSGTLSPLPVQITDGAAASDAITIQYANPASGVGGVNFSNMTSGYAVSSSAGVAVNDLLVPVPGCTVTTVTSTGASAIGYTPATFSQSTSGFAVNLGPAAGGFVSRRYAVAASGVSSALTVTEYGSTTANALVDDIVFMKAQYGLAASASSASADSWVSGATAITNSTSAQVVALRIGVVARSPLLEKASGGTPVTASATLEVLPAITGAGGTVTAAVNFTVPDQNYRYRVYSTIVPLKNVIWSH